MENMTKDTSEWEMIELARLIESRGQVNLRRSTQGKPIFTIRVHSGDASEHGLMRKLAECFKVIKLGEQDVNGAKVLWMNVTGPKQVTILLRAIYVHLSENLKAKADVMYEFLKTYGDEKNGRMLTESTQEKRRKLYAKMRELNRNKRP